MRTGMLLALGVALVGCGDDAKTGDDVVDGDAGVDGSVTPPAPTCGAPVTLVDTSAPDHVVGDGSAASCTQAALVAALAAGGTVTFHCGSAPATIVVSSTLNLRTDLATTIDGGGTVTLDGGGTTQILRFDHPNYRVNTTVLTLQRLTLAHGKATGTRPFAPAPAPCSQGFYDGYGGALYVRDGELVVIDSVFLENQAASLGPDVGGGAISLLGVRRAVVAGSVFRANTGSNGGAINVLNSELDVYDSLFDANRAEGNGANGDDSTKCSVIAETGQHQIGSGGNGGAIVIDGGDDLVHTFCGVQFLANVGGSGALGGALFRTPDGPKRMSVIDRCTFGNNTGESGGAAYFHNSDLKIVATTFEMNAATKGSGALQADGTTFALSNDTFSENTAMAGLGGAISLFGGGGTIEFTTFANNHADGGDPYFGAAIGGNPTLTLRSNIFANNTAKNPGAPMQCHVTGTGDGNIQFPRNHVIGGAADAPCTPTAVFGDPLLGPVAENGGPTATLLPAPGSSARTAGVMCPPTDQRGMPRPATGCTSGSVQAP